MPPSDPNPMLRTLIAGFLAWLVPGLGHFYLGERHRGLICLIVITATFWGGVAIGGIGMTMEERGGASASGAPAQQVVGATVDPQKRTAWFMAQIGTGVNALAAMSCARFAPAGPGRYCWQAEDVAVVYTGVAGLLNLLAILDALARAEAGTKPAAQRAAARSPRGAT
jgi:hypothetical protein